MLVIFRNILINFSKLELIIFFEKFWQSIALSSTKRYSFCSNIIFVQISFKILWYVIGFRNRPKTPFSWSSFFFPKSSLVESTDQKLLYCGSSKHVTQSNKSLVWITSVRIEQTQTLRTKVTIFFKIHLESWLKQIPHQ